MNIGDMIKIIDKSSFGRTEFIPIGTICEIVAKSNDDDGILVSFDGDSWPYWYRESEVEKVCMADSEMIGILGALLDDSDPDVKDMPERVRKDIYEVYISLCRRSKIIKEKE